MRQTQHPANERHTFVDIRRVSLLANLSSLLLLLARSRWRGRFCGLLCALGTTLYCFNGLLGRGSSCRGFTAGSGGGFGGHDYDGALGVFRSDSGYHDGDGG